MKIGIDLGTTNSALAYIDEREAEDRDFPPIHIFETPQLVAPGRIEPRRTLPSFLFLEDGQPVGVYAREQGALVPTKLVHSAKSWLSNPDVDRTAKILPWDSPETGRVLSPVEVSARYIAAFREAWDKIKQLPLADQDIVLTVPASFDEEARELTVMAAERGRPAQAHPARRARRRLLFLDRQQPVAVPQAALRRPDRTGLRRRRRHQRFQPHPRRARRATWSTSPAPPSASICCWAAITSISPSPGWSKPSSACRSPSASAAACAASAPTPRSVCSPIPTCKSVEITVLGTGSSLIGKALKTEVLREEALELALDGFLPITARGESAQGRKAQPLPRARPALRLRSRRHQASRTLSSKPPARRPTPSSSTAASSSPKSCRQRVADVVGHWYGKRPEVFENRDLDLAVATGAAYYSYVRSTGSGVLVRGGLPRTYFIGIGDSSAVCLVPRGAEEGATLEVDNEALQLVANRPVSFRLYSSLTRTDDKPRRSRRIPRARRGSPHPRAAQRRHPLRQESGRAAHPGETRRAAHRNRHARNLVRIEDQRQSLASAVRAAQSRRRTRAAQARRGRRRAGAEGCARAHPAVFSPSAKSPIAPEELPARLEQILGLGKNSWPLAAIRQLADAFLSAADGRKKSPAYEARWLNLGGFCLRPGFGFPGDDFRIEQARRIYSGGIQYANQVQCEIDWWIFWGRLAGGLNRNQQNDIYQRLSPILLPRGGKKQRLNNSLLREMWRTAASSELLPIGTRIELGRCLIRRVKAGDFRESELWCLSRLGARELFYGPINQVVPPLAAGRWAEALLPVEFSGVGDALAAIARRTEDPTRDLAPANAQRRSP